MATDTLLTGSLERSAIESSLVAEEGASYKRWSLVRAYGFRLGAWNFLLSPGTYSELIAKPHWSPLPNVKSHFAGLLNLRGNVLPVYQLASFIDARAVPVQDAPYALLIGLIGQGAAVLLQDKPLVFDFAQLVLSDDYSAAPKTIAHCVKNTYRHEGEVWFEISHDALFSTMAT